MRIQNEFSPATALFQLAQVVLPEPLLLALFGRRLTPVRVESTRAGRMRRIAENSRPS